MHLRITVAEQTIAGKKYHIDRIVSVSTFGFNLKKGLIFIIDNSSTVYVAVEELSYYKTLLEDIWSYLCSGKNYYDISGVYFKVLENVGDIESFASIGISDMNLK